MHHKAKSITALVAGILAIPATALATTEPGGAEDLAFCTDYLRTLEQFFADDGPDPELAAAGLAAMRESAPPGIADAATAVVDAATGRWAVTRKRPAPRSSMRRSRISTTGHSTTARSTPRSMSPRSTGHSVASRSLPAGSAAFRVTNIGEEMHEMGILRKLDGATLSWDEIIPIVAESLLNETDDADQYVEWVGHAWVPTSENSAVAHAELVPGEYAAFCMLPVDEP